MTDAIELPAGLRVGFRERTELDDPFIFRSWLKSHHENGDWPKRLGGCCSYSHRRYYDEHKLRIQRLLEQSATLIACNPERESQIFGFLTYQPKVIHWLYVKGPFRRQGVARALMHQAAPQTSAGGRMMCSHWTQSAREFAPEWALTYDPFLLEAQ